MPSNGSMEDPRRYVDRHGIEPLINQMVNLTIIARADNPESHMVRWLYDQCTPGQRRQSELELVDGSQEQAFPSLDRAINEAAKHRYRDRGVAVPAIPAGAGPSDAR
mmetsp:Transcript_43187/g.101534  ORF Transcript_43187/g.101534 Transcript_43187/m.101534 type:complete len:107 (+) Transcript_43187:60-380(+)